jgi:hypothetical protein
VMPPLKFAHSAIPAEAISLPSRKSKRGPCLL